MTKLVIIIKPGFLDKTNEVIEAYSNLGFSIDERKIDDFFCKQIKFEEKPVLLPPQNIILWTTTSE